MHKVRCAVATATVTACLAGPGCATETGKSGSSGSGKQFEAFEICKDFVKDRLKAPSTAKFRNFFQDDGEVTVSGSGSGPYTVVSTVDSQNGFGAMLRSNFTCTVTNTSGAHWQLQNINVE